MKKNTPKHKERFNVWAEVDLAAVRHNFRQMKKAAGRGTQLVSVVKAQAYGHGLLEVARALIREKTDWLGVADLNEGIQLRQAGIKKRVLLLENLLPTQVKGIFDYRLTPTVCTLALAQALERTAARRKQTCPVHVKIDTGMGRFGVWHEDALAFIQKLGTLKHLRVEGIYTHFPSADSDRAFTLRQAAAMRRLRDRLAASGIRPRYYHAANSMGLAAYRLPVFNMARPGLMLYGLYPHPRLKKTIPLRPVLSVKANILYLKRIRKGQGISYGRTFIARRPMTVATLPIGYNEGYWRNLSNKAQVLIGGKRCRVLGRVTMDLMMVDVSRVRKVRIGDQAVILGRQGRDEITADDIARHAGTINYEVPCSLGSRLPRFYISR